MGVLRILPAGDMWEVEGNGAVLKRTKTKKRAMSYARKRAGPGDVLMVHGQHGKILDQIEL